MATGLLINDLVTNDLGSPPTGLATTSRLRPCSRAKLTLLVSDTRLRWSASATSSASHFREVHCCCAVKMCSAIGRRYS